jgi:hypothetical protein
MRGLFLQNSIEVRLEVQGDSFEQGQRVPCILTFTNRGPQPVTLAAPTLRLALGDAKLVKAKDPSAFSELLSAELERGVELAPGKTTPFSHTFQLDRNAPISEKAKGPFLLYGESSELASLGQLPLTVLPHKYLRAIFDTFSTVFSFIPKGDSSKNGWTSVKLKPPESRAMSFVDELNVSARFNDEELQLSFLFSVKKLDASQAKVGVRKAKTEVLQTWPQADLIFGGEFIRQEFVEAKIREALAEVASGL